MRSRNWSHRFVPRVLAWGRTLRDGYVEKIFVRNFALISKGVHDFKRMKSRNWSHRFVLMMLGVGVGDALQRKNMLSRNWSHRLVP